MARRRVRNPPSTGRRSRKNIVPDMPAARRGTGTDLTAMRLRAMDAVLLDHQRLYDATLCRQDEFDYILHLYEGWLGRNRLYSLFRSEAADEQADPGYIYPRHALLMLLADKKANVPMEMLADLFGTDIDGVSRYLSVTDKALIDVLSIPETKASAGMQGLSADNLLTLDLNVPMVSILDPIRPRTAKNYPGLLASKQALRGARLKEGADAARQRVEEARVARADLSVGERLKQYRRLTDPYTGYPGLNIEIAVIGGLENFHLTWDQTRQENEPLLITLAKKRDFWGTV